MSRVHFDLERVRRNWERAVDPPSDELAPRFARVKAPLDPYPEARALLGRIQGRAASEFAAHTETLAPFFAEASRLVDRLEAASSGGAKGDAKGAADAPEGDAADDRKLLEDLLYDLEDLLEVFAGIGR